MSTAKSFNMGFVDPQSVNLRAAKTIKEITDLQAAGAADYNNMGILLTPQFEKEISDIQKGRGVLGQLLSSSPAVGHPHRYFEQESGPNGQGFSDPRNLTFTSANNGAGLRVEKAAFVRAMTGAIQFGIFDQQTAGQTSIFPQLVAKDLKDLVTGLYRAEDFALWNGAATSLTDGASIEFAGIKNQVTNTLAIAKGADIVDAIRTKVAQMMADPNVAVKPTHIFLNPMLVDFIEKEIKNASQTMKMVDAGEVEVVPGVTVRAINTVAGKLPLVPDFTMLTQVNGTDTDYPFAIMSMEHVESAYIGSPDAQMFKLGLSADLADKYEVVKFSTGAIVKHAAKAHVFGYVTR
ncbi:hypothetical protein [Paenibacillus hexagrammi]|uniref:Major capsid protein n=1 Tax=Paenibacillus hexagrammi TaxID=2908839 RepID=A0ABY3STY3_9BACL|nr:hypothetical protein [Paenibacillus sp. YPD9-1]UJF36535.1 hypothetical protein L0M14_30575 [Paenibacillus sp. YPD9-1]